MSLPMPPTVTKTTLWQRTLADAGDEAERAAKAQLRVALENTREKARKLAEEIPRYLPEFTDHSVDHMDSLWRIADCILPEDYPLNPAEAFVFGCAVLIHDCAMSVAAYPGGMDEIQRHLLWRDLLAQTHRTMRGRRANAEELDNPAVDVKKRNLGEFLRRNHAAQAEKLPLQGWTREDGARYYLIDNERLREHFGYTIGVTAHSHHWPVDRLIKDLPVGPGPLPHLPRRWDVDALKIACLLRVADACHLDERRAPAFSLVLRDLPPESKKHWDFQNRLNLRTRNDDSLIFVSTRPFTIDKAPAWWLAFDSLQMADYELLTVDAVLREQSRIPFAARRIQGAKNPLQLAKLVEVTGWKPIDARLHVSDIPTVVERLGGKQLYGDHPEIVLRELVQNAMDAVRTRRILEGRADDWGEVAAWLEKIEQGSDRGWWLHVRDNGVGMTVRCLSEYLLNFGASYWRSSLAASEHPGLHAKGVQHAGLYGVGFFSVFMLGERVKVITRSCRGDPVPHVLEFRAGTRDRPLLREALPEEQLGDFGTEVIAYIAAIQNITLTDAEAWEKFLCKGWLSYIARVFRDPEVTLEDRPAQVVAHLFPAADVTIYCGSRGRMRLASKANDWKMIDPASLIRRCYLSEKFIFRGKPFHLALNESVVLQNMSSIEMRDGDFGGRLSIDPTFTDSISRFRSATMTVCLKKNNDSFFSVRKYDTSCSVSLTTVSKTGGMYISEEKGIEDILIKEDPLELFISHKRPYVGVIKATPSTLLRDKSEINEDEFKFETWARQQAINWRPILPRQLQILLFHNLRQLNFFAADLPVACCCGEYMTDYELRSYLKENEKIRLLFRVEQVVVPEAAADLENCAAEEVWRETTEIPGLQLFCWFGSFRGSSLGREVRASKGQYVDAITHGPDSFGNYDDVYKLPMDEYIIWLICDVWGATPSGLLRLDELSSFSFNVLGNQCSIIYLDIAREEVA